MPQERVAVVSGPNLAGEIVRGQPAATVVQATLRLARKFSQPEAISFLQGLLEAIARELAAHSEVAQHVQ